MSDENPVDLRTLEPADPPDLVGPAVRRFRWRVVLFTVVTVVVVSALSAWLAASLANDDSPGYVEARTTPEQAAILYGAGICRTPSFTVGGTEVVLIEAATMPSGETALQFIVHGDTPLTEQQNQPDGSSFARFTTIKASVEGSSVGSVEAQPGVDWGEAFMRVPSTSGDRLEMTITGPDQRSDAFTVDLSNLECR
jgi:predicted small integral membrane protein